MFWKHFEKRRHLLELKWLRILRGPEEFGLNVFGLPRICGTPHSTLCCAQKLQGPECGRNSQVPPGPAPSLTHSPCPPWLLEGSSADLRRGEGRGSVFGSFRSPAWGSPPQFWTKRTQGFSALFTSFPHPTYHFQSLYVSRKLSRRLFGW